jgi:uncharacterized protein (DUF2267 family)
VVNLIKGNYMANPNQDPKGQKENKKTMSAIEKRQLVKAIAQAWTDKFDPKREASKNDVTSDEFWQLIKENDSLKGKYLDLMSKGLLNPSNNVSQYSYEVLEAFKNDFKYDSSKQDAKDIQLAIAKAYEDYYNQNNPDSKKVITPATVRVTHVLEFIAETTKSDTLPNLMKHGVLSFGWKLSSLKMEALEVINNYLNGKQKTA